MATYTEIASLLNEATLAARVASACLVAAAAIQAEDGATVNHANRLKWAKAVFLDPQTWGQRLLRAVLAANASATLAQITAATDSTIQTAVNASVNTFADGRS